MSRSLEHINNIKILTDSPYEHEYEIETLIDMTFSQKIDQMSVIKISDLLFRIAFTVRECNHDQIFIGYYLTYMDNYGYLILMDEKELERIGNLELHKRQLSSVG